VGFCLRGLFLFQKLQKSGIGFSDTCEQGKRKTPKTSSFQGFSGGGP
jgi:hypothetical protein